ALPAVLEPEAPRIPRLRRPDRGRATTPNGARIRRLDARRAYGRLHEGVGLVETTGPARRAEAPRAGALVQEARRRRGHRRGASADGGASPHGGGARREVRRLWAFTVAVALALGACFSPGPVTTTPTGSAVVVAPATEFDAAKAKAHVDYLADPARGGRYSGSAGYRDAATYVADRFREIGLEPLGDNGTFFQHFTMPIVDLTEMSTLTGAGGKTYRPRVDFTESVGGRSGSGKAEAEIAAVGGAARSGGLNDFAGANARGKIALVTGPAAPNGGSSVENAYQEGAIGVLIVGGATLRYSYIPRLQSETVPTLVISQEVADQLLAPAGRTVSTAQDLVRARRANPNAPASGFDVPNTVRMTVSLTPVHDVEAINVVGLLRSP